MEVFDQEFTKWLATLGIGGALAAMIFYFYRKDLNYHLEQWKGQAHVLLEVVKENTESNTKLIEVVEALHRRLDSERNMRRRDKKAGRNMGAGAGAEDG